MNCPFCKNNLSIPETSLSEGEFHYDCPHCHSSLLFEKEGCQILVEGTLPEPMASSQEAEEDSLPSEASFDEKTIIGAGEEESPDISLSKNVSPSQGEEVLTEGENLSSETSPQMDEEEEDSVEEVPSVDEKTLYTEKTSHPEQGIQENLQQEASLDEETIGEKKPEDFSDVEKFGNTTGRTHQGPFYYNLLIEEINSKETREHLESVLNDEGLNLPPIKIKDGVLKLRRLTPAATHVIVKALLGWSLKISWEQELAVEMDEEEENPDEVDSDEKNLKDKDLPDKVTPDEITSYDVGSDGTDPDEK